MPDGLREGPARTAAELWAARRRLKELEELRRITSKEVNLADCIRRERERMGKSDAA